MDAAFFRFLGPELGRALTGVRFDTAYCPAEGFWTLAFSPPVSLEADPERPVCSFLLMRCHAQKGALLLSPVKPANPLTPPTAAMWLRKRLRGRRVTGFVSDWPTRSLALGLTQGEGDWLVLSLDDGPGFVQALPEGFGDAPAWPDAAHALDDPKAPRSLRRALDREDLEDQDRFLAAFQQGHSAGFYVPEGPQAQTGPLPWSVPGQCTRFATALEAALAHGEQAFFAALAPAPEDPGKAAKRQKKRLSLLEADQDRLRGLTDRHAWGEAIAANLSVIDTKAKVASLTLDHPERGPLQITLDPKLTVIENMERFFRQAAKGRRGLVHVERLRADTLEGRLPPARQRQGGAPQPGDKRGGKPPRKGDAPIRRYRTSDGFTVLRGRNDVANHRLLSESASPFDFWFHAKGGPGAHVVLKRDAPGQTVPERSMEEAAALAGLSSWQAGQARAEVIWAQVSEVRKVKGAAHGQVRLDNARSMAVALDPQLEARLMVE